MTKRIRLTPEERCGIIIKAGVAVVKKHGGDIFQMQQKEVANACETPTSLETVKYHFPTMTELREAVRSAMASE